MARLIDKYKDDPDFIEWLENQWSKRFTNRPTEETAADLFGDADMAVVQYEDSQ